MAKITPLERAVEFFGNMNRLAVETGYSQHAVWHAVKERRQCSPAMAKAIEAATGGEITKAELRPDIFGN